MPNVPKVLTSFGASDTTTSRTLANVKSAVDPVLAFINTTFSVANDGTLSVLRRIKNFTADTINGTVGKFVTVNATTVNATTAVSASGFKSDRDMGYAWASGAVAATRYQAKRFTQNNEANNTYQCLTLFQPAFPGSIVGVHGYSLGTAGGTFQIQLYKSYTTVPGTSVAPWLQTNPAAANQYYGTPQTFAKGLYSFIPSDYFCAAVVWNTAGNQHVQITLTLEYGA